MNWWSGGWLRSEEAARALGVSQATLLKLDDELKPEKTARGTRRYDSGVVEELRLRREADPATGKPGQRSRKGRSRMKKPDEIALAKYIVEWLRTRNRGELTKLLHEELEMILQHGGKPPNWID